MASIFRRRFLGSSRHGGKVRTSCWVHGTTCSTRWCGYVERATPCRLASSPFAAGVRLADIQTGFRIYSRCLLEATGFPEDRFEAESAVVVRAARRGFRIATVPVELGFADGRSTSHYRPVIDSLRIAEAVIRARLGTMKGQAQ